MTTATLTLTEFLLARIAEDEAAARAVTGISFTWVEPFEPTLSSFSALSPERVLAECEAKRRIIDLHGGEHVCWQPDYPVDGDFAETNRWGDCATLRYVAAVYADHEDYRADWA